VHHHLKKSNGGDPYILEVVRVGFPGFGIVDSLLFGYIVGVEGVAVRVD
jgi:hypothetical protein